jgi:(p)ppGpp synthase/HD superfamily hydrolase
MVLDRWGHGQDEALVCAAWLHDVIEDTAATYQDIKAMFGKDIAELVWAVTDEMGRNRAERKKKTLPKTLMTNKTAILKLADLTANIEDSIRREDDLRQMYIKEWPETREAFRQTFVNHDPEMMGFLEHLDTVIEEGKRAAKSGE